MTTPISVSQARSRATAALAVMSVAWAMLSPAGLSHAAHSGERPDIRVVSYGDLDLNRIQGTQALYSRIRNAAMEVCRDLEDRSLARRGVWRECVKAAIASAVADVDHPGLTAYHAARAGTRLATTSAEAYRSATAAVP